MFRSGPMANKQVVLTVYSREGCHLCDEMLEEIQALPARTQFSLEIVDVDGDDELRQRFDTLVPVLMGEEGEICHYFLDHAAVNAYLGNIR